MNIRPITKTKETQTPNKTFINKYNLTSNLINFEKAQRKMTQKDTVKELKFKI